MVSSAAPLGPVAAAVSNNAVDAAATGVDVALGLVLMTQNGGTVWKVVPVHASFAVLSSLWVNNDPSLKNIFNTPVPGILFSVMSDASGKHVYAVGSPSSLYSSSATAMVPLVNNVLVAAGVQVKTFATILYSGNSGMSWVQQTAPTLYSGSVPYTLFDVAVQKGTTAVAVGGSASIKYGAKSAGTILLTTNGGFSWTQAVYPSSTSTKAPVFTCATLQPSVSGVQAVWVGGFTTRTDAALAGLAVPTTAVDFYPTAAIAGFQPTSGATIVSSGVPRAKGQVYTILLSRDGGKTFAAAPTAGLPTGFVVTSFTHATTDRLITDRSVYGITWDNAQHGWIFGCAAPLLLGRTTWPRRAAAPACPLIRHHDHCPLLTHARASSRRRYGFIMSTQNGGTTWTYETPSDVGVASVTPRVSAIASVPTTY